MARLPQPGSDYGTWGDLLNEFLSVAHNSDGTLKGSHGGAVSSVNGQTGTVTLSAADVGAAVASHTHAIDNVTNLQTSLDTISTNVTTAQSSADDALSVLQTSVMRVVMWNSTTDTWPGRPAGVPAGMVTYNSTNDATATAPTSALTGDLWAKALS